MADLARQMFRDCTYDLKDIQLCRDCYRYSCDKLDKFWFCKPCRPFHELVSQKFLIFKYGIFYSFTNIKIALMETKISHSKTFMILRKSY